MLHTSHHTHYVIGSGAGDPQKYDPTASRETLDHSIPYIFAVALQDGGWHHVDSYAPERAASPVLWLKAEGAQAVELLARAYAMGVPLASDSLLADDLFRLAPLQAIPAAAHARVAQLMAAASGASGVKHD